MRCALIHAEYLSDDEYLMDLDAGLDQLAYDTWVEDQTDAGLIGDCKNDHDRWPTSSPLSSWGVV